MVSPYRAFSPLLLAFALPANAQDALAKDLRLIGEWTTHVERVHRGRAGAPDEVTVTLLGLPPTVAVDRGDRIRFDDPATGEELTCAVVTRDTRDAVGSGRLHVRVRLDAERMVARLTELAPAQNPKLPAQGPKRDEFVEEHGPRATVTALFEPEKGDRVVDFVRVEHTETGVVVDAGSVPTQCRFVLRFSEPVDPKTVGMGFVQLQTAAVEGGPAPTVVATRLLARDKTNTAFSIEPPLGLSYVAHQDQDGAPRRPDFELSLKGGADGIRATSGRRLAGARLSMPIRVDRREASNLVSSRVWILPN